MDSVEPDLKSWKNAHKLFVQAFQNTNSKSVARILKKPLDSEIEKALFDYESFSTNLGRMSLSKSMITFVLLSINILA